MRYSTPDMSFLKHVKRLLVIPVGKEMYDLMFTGDTDRRMATVPGVIVAGIVRTARRMGLSVSYSTPSRAYKRMYR